jgi:ankyrin repeat protein
MKAAELISLLAQLSDVKAFLEVYMASPDTKEKDSVKGETQQIGSVFNELRALSQEVLKDSMTKNPFDIEVQFPDAKSLKAVAEATKMLERLKLIPSVKEHIASLILFRVKFFEFLETERRQDSLCHQIDQAKADLIKNTLENHYYGDPITLAKVTRVSPLLNLYRTAKTKLEIDINTALGFAEDPFSAVHFLHKNLVSETQNDYALLEKLTVDFAALYNLIATAVKEMKTLKTNPTVQKELEPLLDKLPVPFQRLVRCPLFFQEVLKGDKLLRLASFYELHHAKHNQQLKTAIGEVQKIADQMEENVAKVNVALGQHETHKKNEETNERREHFLKIRTDLAKLRKASPKTKRANNADARHVGLVTFINGVNGKMLQAAHKKDTATVIKEIEAEKADINGRDSGVVWGNYSALIIAAYYNDMRLVAALLNQISQEELLDIRAQTGTPVAPHDSALHWAARLGHLEVIEMLTLVDPESALVQSRQWGHSGFIPLHSAIAAGKEDAGIMLLREGSIDQILTKNESGVTPLRMAYDKGQKKLVQKMVDMLLATDRAEHKKALSEFSKHVFGKGKEKKFIGLLYHTVDPKELTLMQVAEMGGLAGIAQAVADKVNLDCIDASEEYPGYTPLMLACKGGQAASVNALLVAHAKVAAQAARGETALHIAVTPSRLITAQRASEIVHTLIQANSCILTIHEDQKGHIPLHTAVESNATREILEVLLTSTIPDSLKEAERKNRLQLRQMNKIQLRETAKDGVTTPFRLACSLGNVEAAKMIFEATLNTGDQKLILHALGYCLLKQKFIQYAVLDKKVSEKLLEQLDKASAEEIIVLASLFRYGNDGDLISFVHLHRTYIDHPKQNLYSILEPFDTKQTIPLTYDGPSVSPRLTLNGELIKCVVGNPEAKGDRTWVHAAKVTEHLGHALSYEPGQKEVKAARPLNSSFWSSPGENPMQHFMRKILTEHLPANDKQAEQYSPPRLL